MDWNKRKFACWEHKYRSEQEGIVGEYCSHEDNLSQLCTPEKCPKGPYPKFKWDHSNCKPLAHGVKFVIDETLADSPMYKITKQISSAIVECQEDIIMSRIHEIGGDTYEEITVDKEKVLDMLRKYTLTKVKATDAYPHRLYCPTCYHTLVYNAKNLDSCRSRDILNNCSACGQRLDWSEFVHE